MGKSRSEPADAGSAALVAVIRQFSDVDLESFICAATEGRQGVRENLAHAWLDELTGHPAAKASGYAGNSESSSSKIVVLGGRAEDLSFTPSVEVLDTHTATWSLGPDLPQGRSGLRAVVLDGKLYTIGGKAEEGRNTQRVDILDIARWWYDESGSTPSWAAGPSLQVARNDTGVAVVRGVLHVVGGQDSDGSPLDTTEYLDPELGAWRFGPQLGEPRGGCVAEVLGDCLLAIGGKCNMQDSNFTALSSVAWLEVSQVTSPRIRWNTGPALHERRYAPGLAKVKNALFAVGGTLDGFSAMRTVEMLESIESKWTLLAPLSIGRIGPAAAAVDDRLYVFGGRVNGLAPSASLEIFTTRTGTWTSGPAMRTARLDPSSVVL